MALTWDINNSSSGVTLSSDKLTASFVGFNNTVRTNVAKKSGKWYWEVTALGTFLLIGISDSTTSLIESNRQASSVRYYHQSNGYKYPEVSSYGASYSTNDTIGVALDLDNGTLEFYKNGVSQGISHTNIKTLNEIYPTVTVSQASTPTSCSVNFGDTPFKYQIPNGYSAYKEIESVNKFLILSNQKSYFLEKGDYSNNVIPVMTSNTTSSGIARASQEIIGNEEAWKAFDGDNNNIPSRWATINIPTGWISYEFNNSITISKYSIAPPIGNPQQAPKDWTFEGSNDGTNWTVLDTQTNVSDWVDRTYKEYLIANDTSYKIYRINISANNGNSARVSITEIQMFELINSTVNILKNESEQNFINYGMNKSTSINLNSEFKNKVFIEQNSNTLGNGKVFSKSIDTTKTPIKKITIK